MTTSVEFFENQFIKQLTSNDLCLNPFEVATLPHLRGHILDFGCGLGNLSIAAAKQGCTVVALDAAPTAIRHLADRAASEGLPITAEVADLRSYALTEEFDAVVAIGLLMFFAQETAHRQLAQLQAHVRPGGIAAINVLIEGTTFHEMFASGEHYLFGRDELHLAFSDWDILSESFDDFAAPQDTRKCFATIIARKRS